MSVERGPDFYAACDAFANNMDLVFKMGQRSEADQPRATEQTQYLGACMSVAAFLKSAGCDEAAGKFYVLAEAMMDLAAGLPHPLFAVEAPNASGGRRPDTTEVWRTRAILCIGLRHLMAGADLDQEDAISLAMKRHRTHLANLQRPKSDLRTSIEGWMKQFATDAVQNAVALSRYKLGMKELAAAKFNLSGIEVAQLGERRIARAAELAASIHKI